MSSSPIHSTFATVKKILPAWLATPIRNSVTALLTPVLYSYRTGHFRSSLKMAAVSRTGDPLPWYTYPAIDFLSGRLYTDKLILEFGAGQSTLWWSARARQVVSFDANRDWYDKLKPNLPPNADLHFVSRELGLSDTVQVTSVLETKPHPKYDVVVIDGLSRPEMFDIACSYVAPDGIILCDNAEGYGFCEGFLHRGFRRVDFYGNAPGIILPHCTSIYFNESSFAFDPAIPIRVISQDA